MPHTPATGASGRRPYATTGKVRAAAVVLLEGMPWRSFAAALSLPDATVGPCARAGGCKVMLTRHTGKPDSSTRASKQ